MNDETGNRPDGSAADRSAGRSRYRGIPLTFVAANAADSDAERAEPPVDGGCGSACGSACGNAAACSAGAANGAAVGGANGRSAVVAGARSGAGEAPHDVAAASDDELRTYDVEGMDCSSCAATIESHLRRHPAVKRVHVNFSTGKMRIAHEGEAATIVAEVAKVGYRARPAAESAGRSAADAAAGASVGRIDAGPLLAAGSGVALLIGFLGALAGWPDSLAAALYAVAMLVGGVKPAKSAYYAVKSGSLDMNVLMTAAAAGAALLGEWLEGATVVWLFTLGNVLQQRSIERTRRSVRALMDGTPKEAAVKTGGTLVRTPVADVAVGQIVAVSPGERIPLDGVVVGGASSVNQAPITGESVPVDKEPGSPVYAGTINENGALDIRVTKRAEDTTVARIIRLIEEAQEQKAPTEAFVDRFAKRYTPAVFAAALAVVALPPLFGLGAWEAWFYRGLELLVIACPCALVISTPVAIVSAIGNAAKHGVLIKGGAFLEIAANVDAVAFDKTGTLTLGAPKAVAAAAYGMPETQALAIARTIEERSRHPLARAIVDFALERGADALPARDFRAIPGKGARADIGGTTYYVGNAKLFRELGVDMAAAEADAEPMRREGRTLAWIGTRDAAIGWVAAADAVRPGAAETIARMKRAGVRDVVMLTGDHEATARTVAAQAGISRWFAELLPEDKVDAVRRLQREGRRVAMIGDGINDAPALAVSDLGVAMGGAGTDAAMETADVVLMADHLGKLPHTIRLSRQAVRIIRQNIAFSLLIKFAALALIFPGWLTLWLAVLSDTGAAILVILNSMRLLALKDR